MKEIRIVTMVLAIAALGLLSTLSYGEVLFQDDFAYDANPISDGGKWTTAGSSASYKAYSSGGSMYIPAPNTSNWYTTASAGGLGIDLTQGEVSVYLQGSALAGSALVFASLHDSPGAVRFYDVQDGVCYRDYTYNTNAGVLARKDGDWDLPYCSDITKPFTAPVSFLLVVDETDLSVYLSNTVVSEADLRNEAYKIYSGAHGLLDMTLDVLTLEAWNTSTTECYVAFDEVVVSQVPEPATMGLLGLCGLFSVIRRKK